MEVDILKKYEAVFILDEHIVEDQGKQFSEEFGVLVKGLGGILETAESMGRKQFTYEINKRKTGNYWDFTFTVAPKEINEIKKKYRLDERILRTRIFDYQIPGKKATLEDI